MSEHVSPGELFAINEQLNRLILAFSERDEVKGVVDRSQEILNKLGASTESKLI